MRDEISRHNHWLGGNKTEGVRFKHNDYVRVVSGEYFGERGSVVSIVTFEENTPYIVESESGKDFEVRESEIEIVDSENGIN